MSALTFAVTGAHAKRNAAAPAIVFDTQVTAPEPIEAMVLRAQIRIEPQWREYDGAEKTLLVDLFDTPDRWGTTLHTLSWADISLTIPAFYGDTHIEIAVPCTYDFDAVATRYLNALGSGDIPVRLLFSGAIFRSAPAGFSTERVPWSSEAAYRMPLHVWHEAMRACYGDDALIRITRETLNRLQRYRALSGATSWDQLFDRLLGAPT